MKRRKLDEAVDAIGFAMIAIVVASCAWLGVHPRTLILAAILTAVVFAVRYFLSDEDALR